MRREKLQEQWQLPCFFRAFLASFASNSIFSSSSLLILRSRPGMITWALLQTGSSNHRNDLLHLRSTHAAKRLPGFVWVHDVCWITTFPHKHFSAIVSSCVNEMEVKRKKIEEHLLFTTLKKIHTGLIYRIKLINSRCNTLGQLYPCKS